MKALQNILFGVAIREVVGSTNLNISSIQIDSRKVEAGTLLRVYKQTGTVLFKQLLKKAPLLLFAKYCQ
jgi:hypothetical protein